MPDWTVQTPVSTIRPTPARPPAATSTGGALIYADSGFVEIATTAAATEIAAVTFTLTERSTLSWHATVYTLTENGAFSYDTRIETDLGAISYFVPTEGNQRGTTWFGSSTLTGAATADAGTYYAKLMTTIAVGATVPVRGDLVVIVGPNTEAATDGTA